MNTQELLGKLAQARHEYAAAMAQVAVARQNRIADGDHERREIRIARVLAMEIQGHELHIANRIAAISAMSRGWATLSPDLRSTMLRDLLLLSEIVLDDATSDARPGGMTDA